jgi:acetyl esterase/lipase
VAVPGGVLAFRVTTPASQPDRTLLFFHGGGFTTGSTAEYLGLSARIADAARAEVFSVDYRLAPEHPFPAAVEDCLAAYCHLLGEGYAPERVVPVGISAGGTLVLSTLLAAQELGLPMPAAAVLLSPAVDMLFLGESVLLNRETDWLAPERFRAMQEDYLAGHDPGDPLASPLYADLSGLPPLLVQAGGGEVLVDGIAAFVSTARLQGVPVAFDCTEGMFHCWQMFAAVLPEGAAAVERVGAFVRRHVPGE